jgi:PST family polysaccharide transporter
MKRVSEGAFWSLIYLSSIRGATLAISIAIARKLGTEGAGAFGVALQAVNFASLLATFYVPQALVRALAAHPEPGRRKALLVASGLFVLTSSALVALGLVALASPLADHVFGRGALVPVLVACGPATLGTALFLWAEGALQGMLQFRTLALWGGTVAALDLLVTIGVAGFGVPAILFSRAGIRLAAALVAGVVWLRPGPPVPAEPVGPELRALLLYAGPALLSSLTALAGHFWIRVALTREAGLAATGLYQVADSLALSLTMIPAAVATAYLPKVARTRESGYAALGPSLERALRLVSGINLPLCLLMIGAGPLVTRLLFGAAFEDSRPALALLGLGYGVSTLTVVFSAIQLARGETWQSFAAGSLWLLVVVVAAPPAIRAYGAGGAAGAVALAFVLTLLSYPLGFARRWNVPLKPLFAPIGATLGLLAALTAASLGAGKGIAAILGVVSAALVFLVWGRGALSELKGALGRA